MVSPNVIPPPSARPRHWRWSGTLLKLAFLLFAGLLLSVGSAWVLPDIGRKSEYSVKPVRWLVQPGDTLFARLESFTSTSYFYSHAYDSDTQLPPGLPTDPQAFLRSIEAQHFERGIAGPLIQPSPTYVFPSSAEWSADLRGMPFRCLWSWRADMKFSNPQNLPRTSALELPGFATGPGVIGYSLPISPLWAGLAANTVFWSALAACVPWAVRRIRHEIRRRIEQSRIDRGLCPSCLYPIDPEVERCPECGRP